MNRREYAKTLYETVVLAKAVDEEKNDTIVVIDNFLKALKPVDLERFSKWGHPLSPEGQSLGPDTPENCWPA